MAKRAINNVKLGLFVLAGLLIMIFSLYMIGKDTNMFGSNYTLKVRFDNVHGLTSGNNVRYAGIQVGTVKKVKILSDTLIEVSMLIDTKMKKYIHSNDIVSMSTDGLMGNRILNITPAKDKSPLAVDGDLLVTKKTVSTDDMLETLDKANRNIAFISEELKSTVLRINKNNAFWKLLDDASLPDNLRVSVANIRKATAGANNMVSDLHALINDVKDGKGSLGAILKDTAISQNLNEAVLKIKQVGADADQLANQLSALAEGINQDLNSGKGAAHAILKDSILVIKLQNSLTNIEKGTAGFNQNMEALKHNFLLRGYFRKLEKRQQQAQQKAPY
ncbi:MAG TPA: MlaD family protein [Chitinophagaceae bacterium]|nr:MlaD family protein [Chitinophagaceae bacterium]